MKLSNLLFNSLKESPKEAKIISHQLMLRSSMIRQHTSGIYTWLPLGFKVLKNIENIIRNNQDEIGCNEMLMSTIQSSELWKKSGRYADYGKEMLRITDRHDNDLLYGPTNEEVITDLFSDYVNSYKGLPKYLYHIQWKFRDEIRPRFGVMRGREFLMKDAYSFDLTEEAAFETYKKFFRSYLKTFLDLGLQPIPVKAATGAIGGDLSHEFQILANTGESELAYDSKLVDSNLYEKSYEEITTMYSASDEMIDKSKSDVIIGRGIEVGHIFNFGTKYTKPLECFVLNQDGKRITPYMGSYGIGVSRLTAAIIEAFHDDKGIKWPINISPFKINIIMQPNPDYISDVESIYNLLITKYDNVSLDDRDLSIGRKIKDSELIGIPWTLIIGNNFKEKGQIELISRSNSDKIFLSKQEIENFEFEQYTP
ncbi:MAG: proline--tRNA ligase [Pelagibacteraceae bacterium]|jgi:prolyl-tRNA synthetase|nr:MAG: proline--tRNA ligase [Pelagibacteraceae bacterium]